MADRKRLIAFYDGDEYARMARVLAQSAAQHCQGWDIRIEGRSLFTDQEITIDQRVRLNLTKLLHWCEAVEEAPDGLPMLLVDCDVMILRPIDDLWDRPFDVAYTVRDPKRTPLPLNAGIVYVRATPAARRFLRAWYDITVPIRRSPKLAMDARKKFGACDQAGLAALLKQRQPADLQILALPCREWNCEDSEWSRFDPHVTRMVHIKGALRNAIFGKPISRGRKPQVAPLVKHWTAYEREARA